MSDTPPLRIALAAVRGVAAQRLPGYVAAVLARSVRPPDTHVYLTAEAYVELQQQFRAGPLIGKPLPPPPQAVPAIVTEGPYLWAELHRAKNPTPALIDSITARIPCGECRAHWLSMLNLTPPDYSSRVHWWKWTLDRHNAVNARIGKPLLTYAQAAARWGWPT